MPTLFCQAKGCSVKRSSYPLMQRHVATNHPKPVKIWWKPAVPDSEGDGSEGDESGGDESGGECSDSEVEDTGDDEWEDEPDGWIEDPPLSKPGQPQHFRCRHCGLDFKDVGKTVEIRERLEVHARDRYHKHARTCQWIPISWRKLKVSPTEFPHAARLDAIGICPHRIDGFTTGDPSRNVLICTKPQCGNVVFPSQLQTHLRDHGKADKTGHVHNIGMTGLLPELSQMRIFNDPSDPFKLWKPTERFPFLKPEQDGFRCQFRDSDGNQCLFAQRAKSGVQKHIKETHHVNGVKNVQCLIRPCLVQRLGSSNTGGTIEVHKPTVMTSVTTGTAWARLFPPQDEPPESPYQLPDDPADVVRYLGDLQWLNRVSGVKLSALHDAATFGRGTLFSDTLKAMLCEYLFSTRALISGTQGSNPLVSGPALVKLKSLGIIPPSPDDQFRPVSQVDTEEGYASRTNDMLLFLLKSLLYPIAEFPVVMSDELRASLLKLKDEVNELIRYKISENPDYIYKPARKDAKNPSKIKRTAVEVHDKHSDYFTDCRPRSLDKGVPTQSDDEEALSSASSDAGSNNDSSVSGADGDDVSMSDNDAGDGVGDDVPSVASDDTRVEETEAEAEEKVKKLRKEHLRAEAAWKQLDDLTSGGADTVLQDMSADPEFSSILVDAPLKPEEFHLFGKDDGKDCNPAAPALQALHCVLLDSLGTWEDDISTSPFSCPLQLFILADSISHDPVTDACGFREPNAISTRLPFFDYVMRECVLKETILRHKRRKGRFEAHLDSLLPLIRIHSDITMPFSYWQHTFAVIQRYARSTPLPPNTIYDPLTQTITCNGKSFTWAQFKAFLIRLFEEAKKILVEKVFLGADMDPVSEELDIHIHNLEDNIREKGTNRTFDSNENLQKFKLALANQLESLCSNGVDKDGKAIPKPGGIDTWLRSVEKFKRILMVLCHFLGGGPARGTEFEHYLFRNTPERRRNIVVMNGEFIPLGYYTKGTHMHGIEKPHPRPLPPILSKWMGLMFYLIVPVEMDFMPLIHGETESAAAINLYRRRIWCSNGKLLNHLGQDIKLYTRTLLGVEFGIADYRQIHTTFARELIGLSNAALIEDPSHSHSNPLAIAMIMQAGHGENTAGAYYGRTNSNSPEVVTKLFQDKMRATKLWHEILGFGEGFGTDRDIVDGSGKDEDGKEVLQADLPSGSPPARDLNSIVMAMASDMKQLLLLAKTQQSEIRELKQLSGAIVTMFNDQQSSLSRMARPIASAGVKHLSPSPFQPVTHTPTRSQLGQDRIAYERDFGTDSPVFGSGVDETPFECVESDLPGSKEPPQPSDPRQQITGEVCMECGELIKGPYKAHADSWHPRSWKIPPTKGFPRDVVVQLNKPAKYWICPVRDCKHKSQSSPCFHGQTLGAIKVHWYRHHQSKGIALSELAPDHVELIEGTFPGFSSAKRSQEAQDCQIEQPILESATFKAANAELSRVHKVEPDVMDDHAALQMPLKKEDQNGLSCTDPARPFDKLPSVEKTSHLLEPSAKADEPSEYVPAKPSLNQSPAGYNDRRPILPASRTLEYPCEVDHSLAGDELQQAIRELPKRSSNESWSLLVHKVALFEKLHGYPGKASQVQPSQNAVLNYLQGTRSKLKVTKVRPTPVTTWINNGRGIDVYPTILDPRQYMDDWKTWYMSNFDGKRGNDWPLSTDFKNCDSEMLKYLNSSGPCGILLLLLSLSWMFPNPHITASNNSSISADAMAEIQTFIDDFTSILDLLISISDQTIR
ncbi:hypothetical protein SISNIDRAFT_469468 [Sistotremastrum niveocremeum HHB9708]|uniref:C2H2-type domain-containing protein n=1 Tax=Sistotremastrum niveocremeum HHB9708 TaxID=1314777 RepID=A0A164PZG8_9AGAM|nr:hypothetical protein SISNIDRAFT_469468 [Sistotremastrum niveocremeum HHB9708]